MGIEDYELQQCEDRGLLEDEDRGLLEDEGGHWTQEHREEQTINDPGMGPNRSKAGELEEEESAGTVLMPHPRPAAFWPFKKPIRPQRCLRNQRRERRG